MGVWHRRAGTQPEPAHHCGSIPREPTHRQAPKPPADQNQGSGRQVTLMGGKQSCSTRIPAQHPPCWQLPPAASPRTHTSPAGTSTATHQRDMGCSTAIPHHHRAHRFCPDFSASLPFLSGAFPSAVPRGTVTGTVSQVTPPTHSQPHPSRACFVIPFSDSSFFTCHPVLLLLSSQLPPAWLWPAPS